MLGLNFAATINPLLNLSWDREMDGDIEINLLHVSGPNDLDAALRVKSVPGQVIKLNGEIIDPNEVVIRGMTTKLIDVSLGPGESAVVRLE